MLDRIFYLFGFVFIILEIAQYNKVSLVDRYNSILYNVYLIWAFYGIFTSASVYCMCLILISSFCNTISEYDHVTEDDSNKIKALDMIASILILCVIISKGFIYTYPV